MFPRIGWVLVPVVCLMWTARMADAQTAAAEVSGRITDLSGAVVPRAEITVTNVDTGDERTLNSNAEGYYVVPFLKPGNYHVTVASPGFQSVSRTGIRLAVDQVVRLDFELKVGQISETIEVKGMAPLLESQTSTVGQVIDNKSVVEMPLNGRYAWQLAQLAGATVMVSSGDNTPVASMAGSRTYTQTLFVDGGSVQKSGLVRAMAELSPMVDALEEFKVITNNYAAEYGRTAGGVFTAATKSGTNQFHGNLFEFFRNDALDARSFFSVDKAPLRYNQYGGTVGGPIAKNRTHFFLAYQGLRTISGSTRLFSVPTAQQREGDFAGLVDVQGRRIQLYDPFSTRPDPRDATRKTRDPYPGNGIPRAQLDAIGMKVASLYPLPNQPGNLAGANNFLTNVRPYSQWHNGTVRVDHTFSEKDRIFGRWIAQNEHSPADTSAFPEAAATTERNIDNYFPTVSGSWWHMFSPVLIHDFKASWINQYRDVLHPSVGQNWPQKLGLRGVSQTAFPRFAAQGYSALGTAQAFRTQRGPTCMLADSITYVAGPHAVKAGFQFQWNGSTDEFRRQPSGDFTFSAQGTGLQGTNLTGNGFASMLLGFVTNAQLTDTPPLTFRSRYYGWFVQDDWKITPALTLNLGLRWDADTARTSPDDMSSSFDSERTHPIAGVPGVVRFAGVDGEPRTLTNNDWNNLGPRFGFAWQPLGPGTVIRGGYGIFYGNRDDIGSAAGARAALGWATAQLLVSPDQNQTAAMLLKNGFPAFSAPGPEVRTPAFGVGTPVDFYERVRATPYSQQFNLGLQQQLGTVLMEAQYLGNLGRKLTGPDVSMNQVRPELVGKPGTIQSRRPFPQFTDVVILSPLWGMSSYHGLMLRAEKRYSQGLQFLATYTFSKFIDNVDGIVGQADFGGSPGFQDFYQRGLDKALSPNDITHNLSYNLIWDLPAGRWVRTGPLSQVIGGWQLSMLGAVQSGPPFGVTTQNNTSECASAGPQRADILRDPTLPSGRRSVNQWFDIQAFAQPARFTFGNAARSVGRMPGRTNFDIGIMKNVRFMERYRIQFRGELFNAFNQANFGNPGTALGSPRFGVISTAAAGRIVQLGLKLYF